MACLLCTSFKGNQESENLAFPGLPPKPCSLPQEADRGETRGLPFFWFGSWAVLDRCREGGEQENSLGEESISPLGSALCGCGRQAAYAVSVRRSSPPQQVIADFSFLSGLERCPPATHTLHLPSPACTAVFIRLSLFPVLCKEALGEALLQLPCVNALFPVCTLTDVRAGLGIGDLGAARHRLSEAPMPWVGECVGGCGVSRGVHRGAYV